MQLGGKAPRSQMSNAAYKTRVQMFRAQQLQKSRMRINTRGYGGGRNAVELKRKLLAREGVTNFR